MVRVSDIVIQKYIPVIKPRAFCVYCYIKMKGKDDWTNVNYTKWAESLNCTRQSIRAAVKKLMKYELIMGKIKKDGGKKVRFVKCLTLSKKSLQRIINSVNKEYNNNKGSKDIKLNKKDKRYKDIYLKIITAALEHERFKNRYYHERKYRFRDREKQYIINLIKELSIDEIDNYVKWWLENKAYDAKNLSIGWIACHPMVEDYKRYLGKKYIRKERREKRKHKNNSLLIEAVKDLLRDMKEKKNYKTSRNDRALLRKAAKEKIVKKINNNWEMRI